MLHTGDPDEGADLNIIKFGTDGKPERTQTPPHPSPEDLFTSPVTSMPSPIYATMPSCPVCAEPQ